MKFLLLILFSLLLPLHLASQDFGNYKPDGPLVVLRDRRSDVEKIAKWVESKSHEDVYEMENQRLRVSFAKESCIWHGWKVEPDTVIEYIVFPKQRIPLERLDLTSGRFSKTADDTLTTYFTDPTQGIQFAIATDGMLYSVRHTPSDLDAALRCEGFMKYDAATERYAPFREIEITGDGEMDIAQSGAFMIELKRTPSKKGTVFIYTTKDSKHEFARLSKMYEKYAFVIHKIPRNQLSVVFGGIRDKTEVETFLVPMSFPVPTARPKYPQRVDPQ